jgi:hypothetical protein
MTTCDGLFEIKKNTIPASYLLQFLSDEQLQEVGQTLYDGVNWNGDRRKSTLLKVVEFIYFSRTHKKLELKYNCPA